MKAYISTSVYRKYLALLAVSGLKLPETINLTFDGKSKECTVLHKVQLSDPPEAGGLVSPTMTITSWAVLATKPLVDSECSFEIIDPELDWVNHSHFWVGKTERVYADVVLHMDKKLTGFGWCGNSERELIFPTFCLVKDEPLFTTQILLSCLELMAPVVSEKVMMGSVDEEGHVTPPKGATAPQEAKQPVAVAAPAPELVERSTRNEELVQIEDGTTQVKPHGFLHTVSARFLPQKFPSTNLA